MNRGMDILSMVICSCIILLAFGIPIGFHIEEWLDKKRRQKNQRNEQE